MRLDKYLKVSRLIKRRTVANEACDNGRISVNGRVVKASYDVKVGDRIEIAMGSRTLYGIFVGDDALIVPMNICRDFGMGRCGHRPLRILNWFSE